MATKAAPLIVLESFVGSLDGADVIFRKGDPIDPSHKAVKKWPQFFGEQPLRYEPPAVEQATAAPGESR
jgi:hypothetical protein